jgi:hypothetical protein
MLILWPTRQHPSTDYLFSHKPFTFCSSLRSKFQEYTRRPRDQFRHVVDRALTKYLNAHSDDAVVFFTADNDNNDDESASERAARLEASSVLNGSLLAAYSAHTPISVPPASPGGSLDTAIAIDADENNAASAVSTPLAGSGLLRKRKRALASEKRRGGASGAPGDGAAGEKASFRDAPIRAIKSEVTFADIGGIDDVLQDLEELVHYPLMHPEIYEHLGVDTPCGILLHGPSGVGKTQLARAIAGEYNVPFYQLAAPEVVSGVSGESEGKIRDIFDQARATAPSIIFIDEIDVISAKRDTAQREMERRIVAQLLASMDALQARSRPVQDAQRDAIVEAVESGANQAPVRVAQPLVIVIGATNRADAIDPALRRAGRFDPRDRRADSERARTRTNFGALRQAPAAGGRCEHCCVGAPDAGLRWRRSAVARQRGGGGGDQPHLQRVRLGRRQCADGPVLWRSWRAPASASAPRRSWRSVRRRPTS